MFFSDAFSSASLTYLDRHQVFCCVTFEHVVLKCIGPIHIDKQNALNQKGATNGHEFWPQFDWLKTGEHGASCRSFTHRQKITKKTHKKRKELHHKNGCSRTHVARMGDTVNLSIERHQTISRSLAKLRTDVAIEIAFQHLVPLWNPYPLSLYFGRGRFENEIYIFLGGRSPLKCKLTYPKVSDFIFFRGRAPPRKKWNIGPWRCLSYIFCTPPPHRLESFCGRKN